MRSCFSISLIKQPWEKLKIHVFLHEDEIHLLGHDFSTIGFTTSTSSSKLGDVKTLSLELAICRSWSTLTPPPTPKANTSTPLSLILLEAISKGVYSFVVVCSPSVITIATCYEFKSTFLWAVSFCFHVRSCGNVDVMSANANEGIFLMCIELK